MPKRKKISAKMDLRNRNLSWLLMTIPAALWIFTFKYLTMAGIGIAFLDYKPRRGLFGSRFIGLENFRFLFTTEAAWRATKNTVILNLLFIVCTLAFALFLANLLYRIYSSRVTKMYQTALLLPNFISYVIVSYFLFALFAQDNGILNMMLRRAGLPAIEWYASPAYWPFILLVSHLWSAIGWGSLIYLAGMLGIDTEIYEAATIDGANGRVQFFSITVPLILPIVVINVLIALGHIFNADFGLFFLLTRNQPQLYPTTDVLDTFIYRALTVTGDLGMASAAQLYQSVVGFILIVAANGAVRKISSPDNDLSFF